MRGWPRLVERCQAARPIISPKQRRENRLDPMLTIEGLIQRLRYRVCGTRTGTSIQIVYTGASGYAYRGP